MRSPFAKLLGIARGFAPTRLPSQRVQMVPTGAAHPELCNLVDDFSEDKLAKSHLWRAQLKADGIRALYVDGRIISREGAPLDCALHALPALQRMEIECGEPMFFDMEYVEEAGFDATTAAHKRGVGTGVCWIHDALPLSKWKAGGTDEPFDSRIQRVLDVPREIVDSEFVGILQPFNVPTITSINELTVRVWSFGYEGIVLKRATGGYRRERTSEWLKIKKLIVLDCPIVDVYLKAGKPVGLMVKGPTGPLKITAGIGATELRAMAEAHRIRGLDGAVARIAYNEKAGSNVPRHPRFVEMVR